MVFGFIIRCFFEFAKMLFNLIPTATYALGDFGQSFLTYVGYGVYFFGSSTFSLIIANVLFWINVEITWIIIEWFYRKIPGVD